MSNAAAPATLSLEQATARMRLMYAKPEHPYYIMAPDYRETSSGIATLHYLCHLLNLNGREAYICGGEVTNPALKTPLINQAARLRHIEDGKVPIAIYPEITIGNPFKCDVVARLLLNFEGFITGRGMDAAASDLLFYSGQLIATRHGNPDGDLLCLPTIDIELFAAVDQGERREGRYLYQNRFPSEQVDYTQLPVDIRLLSMANALTLDELAVLLRKAEVLYTHEWSMTCVIAVLCGCPVIFIPGHGIDQQFLDDSFVGSAGFAMLDQENALERARAGLEGALERYVLRTAPFWQQLDVFIAKTQAAARRVKTGNRGGALSWLRQRAPLAEQRRVLEQRLAGMQASRVCVYVLDDGDRSALERTLESLVRMAVTGVSVLVLGAEDPGLTRVDWVEADPGRPVAALNDMLQRRSDDWFMIVHAGSEFTASGWLMTALQLPELPAECYAVYADEAWSRADGAVELVMRPDLNLDLLLSFPSYLSRHWLYRRDAFLQAAGFDVACTAAFEFDYQLRLILNQGLEAVRHLSEPLVVGNALRSASCVEEQAAIVAHLQARGYARGQAVGLDMAPGRYRIDYGHVGEASVSLLVYLDGDLVQFQRCLESLLAQVTPSQEILLIDPGIEQRGLAEWLGMIEQVDSQALRVMRFMEGQSKAAICNAVAQEARGEYLFWLDGCCVALGGDDLAALLNHARRPEVGAVGGKIVDMHGKIVQAGLVLGLGGTVGQAFKGLAAGEGGYMGRLGLDQNCSAVGGNCLLLRKSLFLDVGGFDSDPLMAPWADVDLCLRLQQAGYLNVWTPYARFLLDKPLPASASAEQEDALYARWLSLLARDPAYNVHCSLRKGEGFAVQSNDFSWHPVQRYRPMVLAYLGDSGADPLTRMLQPLQAMCEAALVDGMASVEYLSAVEVERLGATAVILPPTLSEDGLLALRRLRAFSSALKVFDINGCLPPGSTSDQTSIANWLARLEPMLVQADRVLVASPKLAELLHGRHDDIRLIEPALPVSWGRLQTLRRQAPRARVGWLGGKDAQLLSDVVPALANEVDWIVLGECPDKLRPFVLEVHELVGGEYSGAMLVELELDMALVPLAESLTNACSADMRVLQHAACGHAVICSRVPGFAGGDALPLSRVENNAADWLRVIRLHLDDRASSATLGDSLQAAVREHWLLEGQRLEHWRDAWLPG